jgi:hypothetical protein
MLAISKSSNRIGVSLPSPGKWKRSSLQNVASQQLTVPEDGQRPETQWLLGETALYFGREENISLATDKVLGKSEPEYLELCLQG